MERRPDPNSRRRYRIHLTEAGRDLHQSLPPLATGINQHYLGALESDERSELIHLLQKLICEIQRG